MIYSFTYLFRRLYRSRTINAISILGLSMGIATSLVLALFIWHQLSYDNFHSNGPKIEKVISKITNKRSETSQFGISFGTLKDEFEKYESVDKVVRYINLGKTDVDLISERFGNLTLAYSDYEFFRFFDFNVSPASLLGPQFAVISSKANVQLFNGNGIGKVIKIKEKEYTVNGVADLPLNTQFQFDVLLPLQTLPQYNDWVYKSGMEFHTYVMFINEDHSSQAKLLGIRYNKLMQERWGDIYTGSNYLIPLSETHKKSDGINNSLSSMNQRNIAVIGLIAIICLILGIINYTNFQIASAHSRKHEMGMKKVLGARRFHLFIQVIGESLITVFLSGIIAFLIISLFSQIIDPSIINPEIYLPIYWSVMHFASYLCLIIILGLLTGIYPAIYLSGLFGLRVPTKSEKSQVHPSILGLVIVQFSIMAALLISIFTIQIQMNHLQQQPLGFEKENLVLIDNLKDLNPEKYNQIKSELDQLPGISGVGAFQSEPGGGASGQFIKLANQGEDEQFSIAHIRVMDNYVDLFGLEIVDGQDFNYEQSELKQGFLINESAYHRLFPAGGDPIGVELNVSGRTGPVRGVLKDYHFRSLHQEISPIVLNVEESSRKILGIKIDGKNTPATLNAIEQKLKKSDPFYTLNYKFMDDAFEIQYRSEIQSRTILGYATILAITLSGLGLYALGIFLINTRSKEVAIRKSLGAGLAHILWILSAKIGLWISLGILFGLPLAWYYSKNWLSEFAIRIDLSHAMLIVVPSTLLLLVIISGISIFKKLWEVMHINPVDYLRSE